jgi:hypothetical protein
MNEKDKARFWAKVVKQENGCWEWSSTLRNGYGLFSLAGHPVSAHRLAYKMAYGEIPEGLLIRHSNECVSRACVNPEHLTPGTQLDNMQDRKAAGNYPQPKVKTPMPRKVTKLSHSDIREILEAFETPYRGINRDLAEKYGVKQNTISAIRHGRRPVGF